MQRTVVTLPEIKLVGLKIRTNNQNEIDPAKSKIGGVIANYFGNKISNRIVNLTSQEQTLSVYTNFASDYRGDYDYFYGGAVASFDNIASDLATLIIPKQNYVKFTTPKGALPKIVIDGWMNIWQMSEEELGGERAYIADFEIFDQRASDYQNAVVDIYIGINQ